MLDEVSGLMNELDPAALSGEQALQLMHRFHRLEKMAAAGKTLCAGKMADSNAWYDSGERSPAHLVAASCKTRVSKACDLLDTAELMSKMPATEQAFRCGKLTEEQAIELTSAAHWDAASEEQLLEWAELDDLIEFRRRCARVRAAARSESQRHERAHRRRHLKMWVDTEGAFRLSGSLTCEAGARLQAALEPIRQQLGRQAASRDRGKRRKKPSVSDAQLSADALVQMAQRAHSTAQDPLRPGPQAMVHVRVDHSALLRGHTLPGEICEVPEAGPIPVSSARAFMTDAVVKALLVEGNDVLKVAHLGRTIPSHLLTALLERDQCCVVPGCSQTSGLELDHIKPVVLGGKTALHNLCRLCGWHHYLKTHHGWQIKRRGKRWLFEGPHGPPPDPNSPQPELTAAR